MRTQTLKAVKDLSILSDKGQAGGNNDHEGQQAINNIYGQPF